MSSQNISTNRLYVLYFLITNGIHIFSGIVDDLACDVIIAIGIFLSDKLVKENSELLSSVIEIVIEMNHKSDFCRYFHRNVIYL